MTGHSGTSRKALRFGTVGLANTAIDFAIFGLLVWLGLPALLANGLAWCVAVTFSFVANRAWTFDADPDRSWLNAFIKFAASGALISLGATTVVIAVSASLIGDWPAKILGTVTAMILNFFAARWAIENRSRKP